MEMSQVRARILEVGQLVKQALLARGLGGAENEPEFKVVDGVLKPRRSPFWSRKRGFKYIDDADEHLGRLVRSFELLDPRPGSSVFEMGPGNCYFLFLCRELRGCRVAGVDLKEDDRPASEKPWKNASRELSKVAYRLFREHFGLEDAVRHQAVEAYQSVAFGGVRDYIVATRGVFNRGWREPEYRFWLADCYRHLGPDGKLMVHFNKVDPESLAALPLLRPAQGQGQLKKLSIFSRETLGQVLGDQENPSPVAPTRG
jgi:hypothetical protein